MKLFNDRCSHDIETSQLICFVNQLTGFYMMGTLVVATLRQCPTLIACGHFKAMSYFMDRNCCGAKMLRGKSRNFRNFFSATI